MRYRNLGQTGLVISEIGYGAWGIGKQMWGGADDKESLRALHEAADHGLNFIDTALVYGNGHSERLIGKFLKERRERIYVATKIPPKNKIWPARGPLEDAFPHEHILKCTELSRQNLDVDRIDLLQLHVWDPSWINDLRWWEALQELKNAGKIRYCGVSLNDHQPESGRDLVCSGKIDTVQVIYNIFEQSPEEVLFPLCQEHGIGVIARVPFDEGALTGTITPNTSFSKKDWRNLYFQGDRKQQVFDRIQKLRGLLNEEVESLAQLALKFCLHPSTVSTVIPGMRRVEHVEENVGVANLPPLSEEMVESLREHRWEKNFYPQP